MWRRDKRKICCSVVDNLEDETLLGVFGKGAPDHILLFVRALQPYSFSLRFVVVGFNQ